ncbi:MAG: PliI family lysozyme inhibitor of I-type lysozyme [Chromatiales bacterium]
MISLLRPLSLALLLGVCTAQAAEDNAKRIHEADMPGGAFKIVVAEGALEPRSIGSYDLRIYARTNPHFPYDNFVIGTVRPRDGKVESVILSNLDYLGSEEILVVMRSVGSGGYQTVDGFRLDGSELSLLGTLKELAKDADPVDSFRAALISQQLPQSDHKAR